MRTQAEKSFIKQLLQSPQWPIIEQIARELIASIKDRSCLKETEWQTAKEVALAEGQIQGINGLIHELYRQLEND